LIREHLAVPSENTEVLLCGPPAMNAAMKGHLAKIGFREEQIFRF